MHSARRLTYCILIPGEFLTGWHGDKCTGNENRLSIIYFLKKRCSFGRVFQVELFHYRHHAINIYLASPIILTRTSYLLLGKYGMSGPHTIHSLYLSKCHKNASKRPKFLISIFGGQVITR